MIEGVCERLVKAIVEGEVGVGDWSGQKGAEIIVRVLRSYLFITMGI